MLRSQDLRPVLFKWVAVPLLAVLSTMSIAQAAPPVPSSPTPGLTSAQGPVQSGSTVTLSWGASSGATIYDLGLTDTATGSLVVDVTRTSTQPRGFRGLVGVSVARLTCTFSCHF